VTDPAADDVSVVPAGALRPTTVVQAPELPVDVEVIEYLPNSALVRYTGGTAKREVRTSAVGVPFAIVSKSETAGADTEQREDPERNENREVTVSMNQPLRRFPKGGLGLTWLFNGETFYQSSFLPPQAGAKGTVLQVVRNPGWLMPYVSCILVAVGMMAHFGM